MQKDMKVTIITPAYNSASTIARTIESVINQTYKNIEYIIVDGGSTDDTLQIIDKYKKSANIDFHVISEPDNGVYDAMNKGIERASGELIGIINSDDWYELNAVESIINEYKNNRYEIVYGAVRYWNHDLITQAVLYGHDNLDLQMISHPGCFVTKALYCDYGMYNLAYKSSADYEFMLRIYHSDRSVQFTPVYKIVANFSLGGISNSSLGYIETAKILKEYKLISKKRYYLRFLVGRIHYMKEKIKRDKWWKIR